MEEEEKGGNGGTSINNIQFQGLLCSSDKYKRSLKTREV